MQPILLFAHGGAGGGGGAANGPGGLPAFVLPVGILALVISAVLIIIALNARWERKRTEAMAGVATALGFDFYPKSDDGVVAQLGGFHLFQVGRAKRIVNLMQGAAQGLTISLFDYFYTVGSGKSQHTVVQTVFVARRAGMSLPSFSVRPKSFWDRIGHWFGAKDVEFESHPAFSNACLVKGNDETAIRAVFAEPLLDYLAAHSNVQLEGNGERLMYYRGIRMKPEQMRDFMAEGFAVLTLFPET